MLGQDFTLETVNLKGILEDYQFSKQEFSGSYIGIDTVLLL